MVKRNRQVLQMNPWVKLSGVKAKPSVGFLQGYFQALWPDLREETEDFPSGVELFFYKNQRVKDGEKNWGIFTATVSDVVYVQIHPGKGVNIAYTNVIPEEHSRAKDLEETLKANQGLLRGM